MTIFIRGTGAIRRPRVMQRTGALMLTAALWLSGASLAFAQQPTPVTGTAPAAGTQNLANPSEVVKAASEGMLHDLDANRAAYQKDPAKISALVDKYLLPNFDIETSARAVLGLHWRTATPDQRKRFVDAFYHSLLANYGAALSQFTADKLKIYPTDVDPNSDRATVRTEVKSDGGNRTAVNYVMHKTPTGWKTVDVNIDGISYVKSYHDDFGAQIDQQGMDAVIARLEKGEKPAEINKTVKKAS
jgi:phospholipid transport system substrate-binding protein